MGGIISDIAAGLGDAGSFVNRIWVDWKIGPVMAFLSMVMIFTRDYGLIKDFVRSESRLRKWPRLALYTFGRVVMSVAAYHGPVWVLDWIVWFFQVIWGLMVRLYNFLAGFDQAFIMHGTTAVIVVSFLAATGWAIRCWFVDRMSSLKPRDTQEKQDTPEREDYPGSTVPVYLDDMDDDTDAPGIDDWDNAMEKKDLWRHMKLGSRVRILVRDFRALFADKKSRSGYIHDDAPDDVPDGTAPPPARTSGPDVVQADIGEADARKIPARIGRNKAGGGP